MREPKRRDLGAVAGILSEELGDARHLIENMLRVMKHRGTQTGTACLEPTTTSNFQAAIGCASHQSVKTRIVASQERATAIDGSFFQISPSSQVRFLGNQFKRRSTKSAVGTLLGRAGGYSCLVLDQKSLLAFRDLNGIKPLYISRLHGTVAFASERKALWRIGLRETERAHGRTLLCDSKKTHQNPSRKPTTSIERSADDTPKRFFPSLRSFGKINPRNNEKC